jgi:hypothetical protein
MICLDWKREPAPREVSMIRHALIYLVTAAAAVGMVAVDAVAAPTLRRPSPYDGAWSVVIITEHGDCDRAYRYSLNIENNQVSYAGEFSFDIEGQVARNGRVRVSVSRGSQRAEGVGRLGRDYGTGVWQGASPTGICSGRWEAERRER